MSLDGHGLSKLMHAAFRRATSALVVMWKLVATLTHPTSQRIRYDKRLKLYNASNTRHMCLGPGASDIGGARTCWEPEVGW